MGIAIVYLVIMNLLSFACLQSDKKRASFSRYRIGTRMFYLLSLLGGSIGIWIGMFYYRYHLEKPALRYGIPGILAIQVVLFVIWVLL